jgi:hypothetical protein
MNVPQEFFSVTDSDNKPLRVIDLAHFCADRIGAAEREGVAIDDGNVVDLIADNSDADLTDIRMALVSAGLAMRFPCATADIRMTREKALSPLKAAKLGEQ